MSTVDQHDPRNFIGIAMPECLNGEGGERMADQYIWWIDFGSGQDVSKFAHHDLYGSR